MLFHKVEVNTAIELKKCIGILLALGLIHIASKIAATVMQTEGNMHITSILLVYYKAVVIRWMEMKK